MMNKIKVLVGTLLLCGFSLQAQQIVKLYPNGAHNDNGLKGEEIHYDWGGIANVSIPEIHIYQAKKNPNGKAVIICPGGGYSRLAFKHEGTDMARWLNEKGITGVVLKYRMPNQHRDVPLSDVQAAIRYVRSHARELGVNANQIGIAGSSAGGHLAATASTHYAYDKTDISSRPDFSILFYPVITMTDYTHMGSRENLLGKQPSTVDIRRFSCEEQVSVNTPPTILLLSDDDKTVPVENSVNYYQSLKRNGIPAAMYIFPSGGHGWGFKEDFRYAREMRELLWKWLEHGIKR